MMTLLSISLAVYERRNQENKKRRKKQEIHTIYCVSYIIRSNTLGSLVQVYTIQYYATLWVCSACEVDKQYVLIEDFSNVYR